MPELEERCIHQGMDNGHHALFKEQWEQCKNCAYDPENNKKCPNYSPVRYYASENRSFFVQSKLLNSSEVRA